MVDRATRALIYTRQSQAKPGESEETSLSLQAQQDRIKSHCAREGWVIVDTIADHDLSGERWDRPGIQQLMDRVRAGGIDVVVVFSISRLARKVLHQEMVMDVLTEHGTQLISVTEAGLDNILVRVVHAGMAEQHNVNHRRIVRATIETRARRGLHHGRPPFGYRAVGGRGEIKRLETIPDEANAVRQMYEWRADGLSTQVIADRLNAAGSKSKNGIAWHDTSVRVVLRCPTYAGYAVYRDEIVGDLAEGVAEPIIDRIQWHQVQRSFNGSRSARHAESPDSWLAGLVRHGCGYSMGIGRAGGSPAISGRRRISFRCNRSGKVSAHRCGMKPAALAMEAMEEAAAACLIADLAERPTDPAEIIRLRSEALGQHGAVKQRARLMKQKTTLIEQIKRAEELVTTGRRDLDWFDAFDQDAQTRLAVIESELAELMVIPTEDEVRVIVDSLNRAVWRLPEAAHSADAMRKAIAALGHVVYDGEVRIEYAAEWRDCFPSPSRHRAVYERGIGHGSWRIERCG